MTDIGFDEESEEEAWAARAERLRHIPPEQIVNYSFETICDWLDARREQHIVRLRAACRDLREQCRRSERAHARIAAALAEAKPTA
ncbi:hypothetical protein ACWDE0_21910 [Streptomyces sp. 900105755]